MSDCNRYIIHNPGIQHSHTLRYFSQAHDQGSKNRKQISTVSIIYYLFFFLKDCYYYLLYLIIHTTLQFALEKQLAHRAGWLHIFISLFATSSGSVRTPARYNGDCVWHNVAWCRLGLSTQTHTPLHKQLSPYSLLH